MSPFQASANCKHENQERKIFFYIMQQHKEDFDETKETNLMGHQHSFKVWGLYKSHWHYKIFIHVCTMYIVRARAVQRALSNPDITYAGLTNL